MEITKDLERRLRECYTLKLRKPHEKPFNFLIGGQWFCPQCGVSTLEEKGSVRCPKCKLSLNEFINSLIEFHPHFNGIDGWY
ncbi:MAG: hypothetical protein HZB50_16990 [Chloroflexi bacterium]|nr:hypothetical protein [Chloroflexota bacterium]